MRGGHGWRCIFLMPKMPSCCPGQSRRCYWDPSVPGREHCYCKEQRKDCNQSYEYQREHFGGDHGVLKPSDYRVKPLETNSAETSDFSKVQPSKRCRTHTVLPEAINGPQGAESQEHPAAPLLPSPSFSPPAPPWMSLQTKMRSVWMQRHPSRATRLSEFSLHLDW